VEKRRKNVRKRGGKKGGIFTGRKGEKKGRGPETGYLVMAVAEGKEGEPRERGRGKTRPISSRTGSRQNLRQLGKEEEIPRRGRRKTRVFASRFS